MKSKDFQKIYNKIINPFLKKEGFKVSGFKATKEDEQFYYLVYWGVDKYGGRGYSSIHIHPKGLPKKYGGKWDANAYKDPSYFTFRKKIALSNGNEELDLGVDEAEATETCQFLLEALEQSLDPFQLLFKDYPKQLLEINTGNFEERYSEIYRKFGLAFNFEDRYEAAIWLGRIHCANQSKEYLAFANLAEAEMRVRFAANGTEAGDVALVAARNLKQGVLNG